MNERATTTGGKSAGSQTGANAFPFPVVGIGASAGGVEAIGALLEHLPPDTGAAFVVVLHLDPDHESHLAEVLGRRGEMPVVQAEDRMPLDTNRVYVIAPDRTLTIEEQHLRLKEPAQPRALRTPVDELFVSLSRSAGNRAVAVVMSGTGSNGSAGLAEVKARGGAVLAQDPATAAFSGMPANAIHTGHVDQVLAPPPLARTIAEYVRSSYVAARELEGLEEAGFNEALDLLRGHSRVELKSYRRPTIARRLNRRMGLKGLHRLEDYVALLKKDVKERDALGNDLMINVTSFFRDPDSWDSLKKNVVAPLVQSRNTGAYVRCWVTACSSGEEAYSLAMLLTEEAEAAERHLDIKIFATDLSEAAISRARTGVYPDGIATQVSPERLERFFEREDHHYRIVKRIRERVVFASHNLLADPPFSHLDIVTCRNVLIYLQPDVQRKVLKVLHFALRQDGALMLGSSETTHRHDELFQPLDGKHKIYRRVGPPRGALTGFPVQDGYSGSAGGFQALRGRPAEVGSIALRAVAGLTPAAALLDARHRVLYFHGRTDPYLAHPQGQANLDVYAMARAGLEAPIRSALSRASNENAAATSEASMMRGDRPVRVVVTATPLREHGYVLLAFHEATSSGSAGHQVVAQAAAAESGKSTDLLRQELRRSNDDLARTIEDLERTNEDLTASNEEVMSVNEELQSTNEELETSKEELQSLNEELATVNAQLQNKLDELETTSSNLANLLKSSDIATLFLSRNMDVKWFTPAVGRLFSLIETDIGRPISDLAQKFIDDDMAEDCLQVLKTLVPIKREVKNRDGRWYLRRVTPYRTTEDKIDGVVLTFVDITNIKESQRKLRRAASKARKAAAAKDFFLARLSHELRTPLQPVLLGLSGIADEPGLPKGVAERVTSITRNLEIEMRLIDDLLDVTRIGRGHLKLNPERVDLFELVQESVRLCSEDSDRKKQQLIVEGSAGDCVVEADRIRLQQVVWNLLHNAIRFTSESGAIKVLTTCRGDQALLEVSDDGAGIPPNLLPRIFDSFERFDSELGGLGLGLSIAKAFVEAHGGKIEAFSEGPGRGATFRVCLPRASSATGPAKAPAHREHENKADISGLRILVIEDHRDSAQMLASLLRAAGCRTETAGSVNQALKAVMDFEFDLILSDLGLPDGSGYELMHKLPDDIPAIALSGYGSPDDKKRSLEAGFAEHLVKPVTLPQLRAAIARATDRRPDARA